MKKILTLNNISPLGLERFPRDQYEVASEIQHPDAIVVRSANMHALTVADSLKAVGRAGAGVNNIPVDDFAHRGIVVFNAPGANANAVKELTIAAMFMAARNLVQAWDYTRQLQGEGEALQRAVEEGKKQFAGSELPGKTLGVVGLGAIGVQVANAAVALGMRVVGYDPAITVRNAWQLSSQVQQARGLEDLLAGADFVSFHVPLVDATRNMLNASRMASMKRGAVVLNMARDGVVNDDDMRAALDAGHLAFYVTDFPHPGVLGHPRMLALPHLGASTAEAEDHCAIMVAEQIRDFLEHGNIVNSVNYPEVVMGPVANTARLAITHDNEQGMINRITGVLSEAGLNIVDLLNKSRGDHAYTLLDVSGAISDELLERMKQTAGVRLARRCG